MPQWTGAAFVPPGEAGWARSVEVGQVSQCGLIRDMIFTFSSASFIEMPLILRLDFCPNAGSPGASSERQSMKKISFSVVNTVAHFKSDVLCNSFFEIRVSLLGSKNNQRKWNWNMISAGGDNLSLLGPVALKYQPFLSPARHLCLKCSRSVSSTTWSCSSTVKATSGLPSNLIEFTLGWWKLILESSVRRMTSPVFIYSLTGFFGHGFILQLRGVLHNSPLFKMSAQFTSAHDRTHCWGWAREDNVCRHFGKRNGQKHLQQHHWWAHRCLLDKWWDEIEDKAE